MTKRSAGIVLYRRSGGHLEVLLGHMGGPLWARKDAGAWSIPKGEYGADEDPFVAACREFHEELGMSVPTGAALVDLGEVRQAGGKIVRAWAVPGDLDHAAVVSNTFDMEWPPRSGTIRTFPEIDRAAWFELAAAHDRIVAGQRPLLERLDVEVRRD
jgi:predicted NUDIX family NTP pyrophosphohydrolase